MVVQQCSQEALKLDAFCGRDPHVSGSLHLQQLNSSILNHLPNSVGFAQPLEPSTSWCLCPDFHLYGKLKAKVSHLHSGFPGMLGPSTTPWTEFWPRRVGQQNILKSYRHTTQKKQTHKSYDKKGAKKTRKLCQTFKTPANNSEFVCPF